MANTKKNILFISFDDAVAFWDYKTVFGEALHTPSLDRFCEKSTAFRRAYCQAPVCGPSRASFMSAKMPHETGVHHNKVKAFEKIPVEDFWSYQFKNNGYFCSSGGKVHHGFRPLDMPFHKALYSDRRKRFGLKDWDRQRFSEKRAFGGHRNGWGTTDPKEDGDFYDARSADSAISFLQTYDGDIPFYREVGLFSPHAPHITPVRFKEMYCEDKFIKPPEWEAGFDNNDFTQERLPENPELKAGHDEWWRRSVRNYFSALSHGDYHLGRILDALAASPHAENTIVAIVSDHGFHLGNRNRYMKSTLWEQVARVPMIVYDPFRPTPHEVWEPVALIDIGPTLLDMAGLEPLADTFGISLAAQLRGESAPNRVIPTIYYGSAAVHKGDFHLIRYEDGSTQLFNVKDDFWELRDLGQDHPEFKGLYADFVDCCDRCGFEVPDSPY